MFFTNVGRFIAFAAIAIGLIALVYGWVTWPINPDLSFREQLADPNARAGRVWAGECIYIVGFGIVLGILTDISRSLASTKKIDVASSQQ